MGETENSVIISDEQQKIFEITNPGRSLAYALVGMVGMGNEGEGTIIVHILSEIENAVRELQEQRFVDPAFYVRKLCRRAHDKLKETKESGQLKEYSHIPVEPAANEQGQTIARLFVVGYYEGAPICFTARFFHCDQNLGNLEVVSQPLHAGQDFGYGSNAVWTAMNQGDRRFKKYVVRKPIPPETLTIPQAVAIAHKRILSCCDREARLFDPNICNGIGGHIHIAKVTREHGFEWIPRFEPVASVGIDI